MMTDLTQTAFGDDQALVPTEQVEMPDVFDYRLLSADKREFVMQKTDETQILLKRTAENIIQIGKNLKDVKEVLPHGMFLPWLKDEFDLHQTIANDFMHVADRFDGKLRNFLNFHSSALYLLASPKTPPEAVDDAVQRAEKGEKITHALAKQIVEAQIAIKEAQKAEAEAKAEALKLEQLLFKTEVDLNKQVEDLKKEMESLVKPEVQIQIQEKEVIPEAVAKKLETWAKELADLQQNIKHLEAARDSEKARADGFAKRFIDELPERQQKEANERIRAQWHVLATEFQSTVKHLISEWPTVLDARAFDTDEWAEVDIIREAAARVVGECERFRHKAENVFVDANGSVPSYALSLMEQ